MRYILMYIVALAFTFSISGCSYKDGGYYFVPKTSSYTNKPVVYTRHDLCVEAMIEYNKVLNSDNYDCFVKSLERVRKYCK